MLEGLQFVKLCNQNQMEAENWGSTGVFTKENPGIWSLFKKVINGMDIKVTYWESQLFIGETWPWTKYLRLYCNLADFVQPSNIENIHFCMPSKIFEELQQNKFWKLWRNLNETFSVSRNLCCSFIFNFLNLVNKSHRKYRLLENQQSGQEPLPLLANNCWEIWQNSASKQADSEESTTSSNPNFLCKHSSSTCSS